MTGNSIFEQLAAEGYVVVPDMFPGSHRLGRLNLAQALNAREVGEERVVPVARGGVMVMRPLLLHASSKASVDLPRRVLHFVFGPSRLAEGLSWRSSS